MPIYEYCCDACGERLEALIRTGTKAPQKCPKCGSKLRKLPSSPAIQFKGSGFYITDYAHKNSPSANGSTPAPEGKPAPAEKPAPEKKKTETKTDPSGSSN
jgi:putative FmdB family regulatory protein